MALEEGSTEIGATPAVPAVPTRLELLAADAGLGDDELRTVLRDLVAARLVQMLGAELLEPAMRGFGLQPVG